MSLDATAPLRSFIEARDDLGRVEMWHGAGPLEQLDATRWLNEADPVDSRMLSYCDGPTLDIGCGPGRLTAALLRSGLPALGVDICAEAVRLTRERGGRALQLDVFSAVPDEGRWAWVLLADGNIGIGGDPGRLLRRVGALAAQTGRVLVELNPRELDLRGTSRLRGPGAALGPPFAWASVGLQALAGLAGPTGWQVDRSWQDDGRSFAVLSRATV